MLQSVTPAVGWWEEKSNARHQGIMTMMTLVTIVLYSFSLTTNSHQQIEIENTVICVICVIGRSRCGGTFLPPSLNPF
jgi:hypothetical protein